MAKPIFSTSYLGIKIAVFPTHISYKVLFAPELTIPIKQITAVEMGNPFQQKVKVETSSGKKHAFTVRMADKEALRDAIYGVMS